MGRASGDRASPKRVPPDRDPRDEDPNLHAMLQAAWNSDEPVMGTVDDDGKLTIQKLNQQPQETL